MRLERAAILVSKSKLKSLLFCQPTFYGSISIIGKRFLLSLRLGWFREGLEACTSLVLK